MSADPTLTILVPIGLSFSPPNSGDSGAAAVSAALRIQENGNKPEVVAVSAGGSCAEEALLAALARGANRAVLVETPNNDPRSTSLLLATLARREKPDLIVFGYCALEDPTRQIAPRLAAILGWPHASGVFDLKMAGDKQCRVARDLDSQRERLELALPAVLSINAGEIKVPLLSLYEIVAARSKSMRRMKSASLGKIPPAGFTVLKSEPATIQRKGRMVANVDELIDALRDEAHVI